MLAKFATIKNNDNISTVKFNLFKELYDIPFQYIYFGTNTNILSNKLTYHDYYYIGNKKNINEYDLDNIIFSKFIIDNFIDCMNNNIVTNGEVISSNGNCQNKLQIYDFKIESKLNVQYISKKDLIDNDDFVDIQFTSNDITTYEQLYQYVTLGYLIKNEFKQSNNSIKFNISNDIITKYSKFFFRDLFIDHIRITKYLNLNDINYNGHNNILTLEKNNKYTLYYFEKDMWQKPVITEKNIFDLFKKNNNLPDNYLAFPWATLIDNINTTGTSELLFITKFKCLKNSLTTTCQHIYYRDLLPLFKQIGVTTLFVPHLEKSDYIMQEKYGITLYPISLYPLNKYTNNTFDETINRKYLFSFVGAYDKNVYMSTIRQKMLNIPKNNNHNIHIKINDQWFYNKNVYDDKTFDNTNKDIDFQKLLLNSKYSLCPSGTGCNSIRFFESLSYGSIPILLSDEIILSKIVKWSDFIIQINECEINKIYDILEQNEDRVETMSNDCIKTFLRYFDYDKFDKQIIWHIENKPEYFIEFKNQSYVSYYDNCNKICRFNWASRIFNDYFIEFIDDKLDTIILKRRYDELFDYLFYLETIKANTIIMYINNDNEWLIMVNILIHKKIYGNKKKLMLYKHDNVKNILVKFDVEFYSFLDDKQMKLYLM